MYLWGIYYKVKLFFREKIEKSTVSMVLFL